MDPYYDDGEEMVVDSSEYPDPDYTPRFPWVGTQGLAMLEEEFEDTDDDAELSVRKRSVSSNVLDQPDNFPLLRPQTDPNDPSLDPDFDVPGDEEM